MRRAYERAREWLDKAPPSEWQRRASTRDSLAALLREVKRETTEDLAVAGEYAQARSDLLAEVRRVVEEEREQFEDEPESNGWLSACDRILSRLEQLK